jgi:hypothetical protein
VISCYTSDSTLWERSLSPWPIGACFGHYQNLVVRATVGALPLRLVYSAPIAIVQLGDHVFFPFEHRIYRLGGNRTPCPLMRSQIEPSAQHGLGQIMHIHVEINSGLPVAFSQLAVKVLKWSSEMLYQLGYHYAFLLWRPYYALRNTRSQWHIVNCFTISVFFFISVK